MWSACSSSGRRTRAATAWISPGCRATRCTSRSRTRSPTFPTRQARSRSSSTGPANTRSTTRRRSRPRCGDDPIILPLITTIQRELEPHASFSGIVREDDFAEGELDLDALGRWNDADAMSPTFAGVLLNRSDVNAIGLGLIPGGVTVDPMTGRRTLNNPGLLVVPALVEIDVRLRTDVQMDCEYYVRERDDDDRLLHNDGEDPYQISPTKVQPAPLM